MNILILGGTIFLGRALVQSALTKGHTVTLFNRGKSNPKLFSQDIPDNLTIVHGDRTQDIERLQGRKFDAVIDTCGYVPAVVQQSAEFFKDIAPVYTFISSVSVYEEFMQAMVDEESKVLTLPDDADKTKVTNETYGVLKALCEQEVQEVYGQRAENTSILVRPGLIVGEYDPTDRFTYWVERVHEGGEILVPGRKDFAVAFVDVHDVADFTLTATEQAVQNSAKWKSRTFNVSGPSERLTIDEFLQQCLHVAKSNATFTWVSQEFLSDNNVGPWMEMPLWIPDSPNVRIETDSISCEAAIAEGLQCRSVEETIQSTLNWLSERRLKSPNQAVRPMRAGISQERETELLKKWHSSNSQG
jgi:2'-hydroxyisoflavone reductase